MNMQTTRPKVGFKNRLLDFEIVAKRQKLETLTNRQISTNVKSNRTLLFHVKTFTVFHHTEWQQQDLHGEIIVVVCSTPTCFPLTWLDSLRHIFVLPPSLYMAVSDLDGKEERSKTNSAFIRVMRVFLSAPRGGSARRRQGNRTTCQHAVTVTWKRCTSWAEEVLGVCVF